LLNQVTGLCCKQIAQVIEYPPWEMRVHLGMQLLGEGLHL